MLKDDKKTPLNMIPSFTHSKINDGCGIGYSPLSLSNVTGNHNALNNYLYMDQKSGICLQHPEFKFDEHVKVV